MLELVIRFKRENFKQVKNKNKKIRTYAKIISLQIPLLSDFMRSAKPYQRNSPKKSKDGFQQTLISVLFLHILQFPLLQTRGRSVRGYGVPHPNLENLAVLQGKNGSKMNCIKAIFLFISIHIHICIHTYIHTYIHIYYIIHIYIYSPDDDLRVAEGFQSVFSLFILYIYIYMYIYIFIYICWKYS